MMVSPEEVMKRMWEELGVVWERDAKRLKSQPSSSESSQGSVSYIFSPILVKTGAEVRNVSSFSSASTSSRGGGQVEGATAGMAGPSGEARGANSSPLFTFDVTREMRGWKQGWRGRMDMTGGLLWGVRSPMLFVDDVSMPDTVAEERRIEEVIEERENVEEEDVFDMSKIE